MNKLRIMKLLDEHLGVEEHEQNKVMVELLEALLDDDFDPNLGKTDINN